MTRSSRSPRARRLRELLTAARLEAGLTQRDLAARLGRLQSFIPKYELGDRRVDVVELIEISEAIGCDPAKIFLAVLKLKDLKLKERTHGGKA